MAITRCWQKSGQHWYNVFLIQHNAILENFQKYDTSGWIVVDYYLQKDDPYWTHLTVGGNLIKYTGEVSTRNIYLTTTKILTNSTISTPGVSFMWWDINIFKSFNTHGMVWIHLPPHKHHSWVNHWPIQHLGYGKRRIRVDRNPQGNVWSPTGGQTFKQSPHKNISPHG